MTPARAIQAGADYLVVGRPITGAADPKAVADAIQAEIAQGLLQTAPVFSAGRGDPPGHFD